jgi:hypothetical protein
MTIDRLNSLLDEYSAVTDGLNAATDKATDASHQLTIAKAEVSKWKYKKDLIEEQIRCEKKLIDII